MTKADYENFRREFENVLAKYKDVVEDRVIFEQAVGYSSTTLVNAEHDIRKGLMEMYVGLLDIVYKCEDKGWKDE